MLLMPLRPPRHDCPTSEDVWVLCVCGPDSFLHQLSASTVTYIEHRYIETEASHLRPHASQLLPYRVASSSNTVLHRRSMGMCVTWYQDCKVALAFIIVGWGVSWGT